MEIACLDLGSNSFHLQHFQLSGALRLTGVLDCKRLSRLGASVAQTGTIDEAAWEVGIAAVRGLLAKSDSRGPVRLCAVATSAIRSARNGSAFLSELNRQFELEVEILSGIEEARLSYWGAVAEREQTSGCVAVVDLGGGSTELTVGCGMDCLHVDSLPLGVLGMAARFQDQGYTRQSILKMTGDLKRRFGKRIALAAGLNPHSLLFASGTARAVRQLVTRTKGGSCQGVGDIQLQHLYASLDSTAHLTPAELVALEVESGRLDTVRLGHVAMIAIMECFGCNTAWVSRAGVRYGLAAREFDKLSRESATAA